jgi:glucosamine--fructose-6-phosphate aminotransferase (isomerizing)
MTRATPFEADIAEQPDALRRLAGAEPPDLHEIVTRDWERIILTGMGSSGYAGIPTWRRLVGQHLPAWNVDCGQLLDNLSLITPDTLLVITSQSGASGEVVELLRRIADRDATPGCVVGIADDAESPLATGSDVFLPLHSGPEATVSTKSYLNSLGVHRHLIAAFAGEPHVQVAAELEEASVLVQALLDTADLSEIATAAAQHPLRRLAFVGRGDHAATAQFAGLITKESSKVPAEGFVGGQFRHGPFELAGDGLTVVVFGLTRVAPDQSLLRLSADLVRSGSRVVVVGDAAVDGALTVEVNARTALEELVAGAVVAQLFAVGLARANGVVPGAFRYGSKVTTEL